MGLIDTIADFCATELNQCEYRLTVLGGNCVYAEGIKRVAGFSSAEITLVLKCCQLKIVGECLRIEKFCGGDAIIKGKVKSIERVVG